jgi:hypothetical protein
MTCTLMRYPAHEMQREVHAHEMHAREVHAYEMHAHRVQAHETHPREMHAHKMNAPIRCTCMKRTLMRYISYEIHVSALAAARLMERP